MKTRLPNVWGYGQLFGYSALEGPNRYYDDFVLMTMKKKCEFRVEFRDCYILIKFPMQGRIAIKEVLSDFVTADNEGKPFIFTYAENDTLCGISPVLPVFSSNKKAIVTTMGEVTVYQFGAHFLALKTEKKEDGYHFVIHNSFSASEGKAGANFYLGYANPIALVERYHSYYEKMPKCIDKHYAPLFYKALSVNKVNVHSPEGKIQRLWTTPDRVPHRHMWMWDSAFHAIAMSEYAPEVAEQILLAMLEQARPDGFIPHMANPTDRSDITQPCVMSWAALFVYQRTKNKEFLKACLPYLKAYLEFDLRERDENLNLLLEWATDPLYIECKCGESGLDNSPRFDFDQKMDCIDFSSYLALDLRCLRDICAIVDDKDGENHYGDLHQKVSKTINDLMWDEEDGVYYDRLFNGELTKVLTPNCFLPLFAGICDQKQADRMVKVLFDSEKLNTEFPFASIEKHHPEYSTDMWRGGAWLNINYFLCVGLRNYGYDDLAKQVRDRTLEKVNYWYKKTGCVFEFYDSADKVCPLYCDRKGKQPKKPDYRKHVHSISDFNWTACFIFLFIQNIYK